MKDLRLRTKFLFSMVLVSAGLTGTTLLLVRRTVTAHVREQVAEDLRTSVAAFRNTQEERGNTLQHAAQLLADLPNVRALMTTRDAPTIQDASQPVWQLVGSDLLALAEPSGKVLALHAAAADFTVEMAEASFQKTLAEDQPRRWWYGPGHLYEVFVQPVYFGSAGAHRLLGYAALGYEIDDKIAQEASRVAASQVVFLYSGQAVRGTLSAPQQKALLASGELGMERGSTPRLVQLGQERFLMTTVALTQGSQPALQLVVLKSFDQATAFLDRLNRMLLGMGLAAVFVGSLLVLLIAHTFTRPLETLVEGVRALGRGDYSYPLEARGEDEVAEVTSAFGRMRQDLQKTQQELLEAERLATIGRMASSISHDLRHSLAAIVANAEFLCEASLSPAQREELYGEIRVAVNQMTDLIESLLEFSRTRESLHPSYGSLKNTIQKAIHSVQAHPGYQGVQISISNNGSTEGWFDHKKLERVFYNLLLNACEALRPPTGKVNVVLRRAELYWDIRVEDNGGGVSALVQNKIFEPFFSVGKENGAGMGLTVVQKIVQDHGGNVVLEKTSPAGTVFTVRLPCQSPPGA